MNKQTALKILKDFQKYRRGEGEYSKIWVLSKYSPEEYGLAIDWVMDWVIDNNK